MIDGKTIKFGYGTVCVGNNYSDLTFRTIKPPQEIGASLTCTAEIEYWNDVITISMAEHYHRLKEKLTAALEVNDPCIVVIDDYVLDFTNYNSESIEVVLEHATHAYYHYIRLCAV